MDREPNGERITSVLCLFSPLSFWFRTTTLGHTPHGRFTRVFETFPHESRRSSSWQTQKQQSPPVFRFRIRKASGDRKSNRLGVEELQIGTSTYLSCFG